MDKQSIIYIGEDVQDIPLSYFPISNSLQSFLRREKVKIVGDLRELSPHIIEQILYNKKKPFSELKQLIVSIQENDSDEIVFDEAEVAVQEESKTESDHYLDDDIEEFEEEDHSLKTINDLLKFINEFVAELKGRDKDIFLGRLGANTDEKPVPMVQICGQFKLSPDFVGQTITALVNEISSYIGKEGKEILKKIKKDCFDAVCPLTPRFLVYLTNNQYNLFEYPPSFYIRLIEKLSPDIPIVLEDSSKKAKIGKEAVRLSNRIKKFLQDFYLPVSLGEVFNALESLSLVKDSSFETFFEAINSNKFNLIKAEKPNELLIELNKINEI
jgi:hypothetical protein